MHIFLFCRVSQIATVPLVVYEVSFTSSQSRISSLIGDSASFETKVGIDGYEQCVYKPAHKRAIEPFP